MNPSFKSSILRFSIGVLATLLTTYLHASKPLWSFTADAYYPPNISITSIGTAYIQYTVTNQSQKTHTLVMKPIAGVTQVTTGGNCSSSFTLAYQQSCTLQLLVNGSMISEHLDGGPIVCQQGDANQCYQPDSAQALNITRIPIARYLVTPVSTQHGSISPSTAQTVVAGTSLDFIATPAAGYHVHQWLVDGGVAQRGGGRFTLSHIDSNKTVEATFIRTGTLYAGTEGGYVYFSTDNGLIWSTTTSPSFGHAVNSVFSTQSTLYVGSEDGRVYHSTNNGVSWGATAPVPGGVAVTGVYVANINNVLTIYAGTQNGVLYYSTDGSTWTATTNPGAGRINSIFINTSNTIYVGSHDGNVYFSINNGSTWNTIHGPSTAPVQNVFASSTQLYINTRQTSSNSTLPAGTVDFEYAYSSDSLTNSNPTWTLLSQITYTLFFSPDSNVMYAATQDGYVFSLTTGDELGFITYSPINSLFFLS